MASSVMTRGVNGREVWEGEKTAQKRHSSSVFQWPQLLQEIRDEVAVNLAAEGPRTPYTYDPLASVENEIRLAQILPNLPTDFISCKLERYEASSCPKYCAISYC